MCWMYHHQLQQLRYPTYCSLGTTYTPLEKLKKYGAIQFKGTKEDDLLAAKFQLKSTNRVLEQLQCLLADSLMCVVSLLNDEAYKWCTILIQIIRPKWQTYEVCSTEFKKKYVGFCFILWKMFLPLFIRRSRFPTRIVLSQSKLRKMGKQLL